MRKDNFRYLLVALILYLIFIPALRNAQLIPQAWLTPFSFIFLAGIGVWSLKHTAWVFKVGMSLAAAAIALNLAAISMQFPASGSLAMLAIFLFLLLATWSSFRQIATGSEISSNRIFGAICVYLLLGVAWSLLYSALHAINPDAFSGAVVETSIDPTGQWLYYSFVTLTTLGYGDILPVSPGARALAYAEAIFGVFYMATVVAMLVGAYVAQKQR